MKELLLILILFGDPTTEPVAGKLAGELARLGGAAVQVVVGAEAAQRLDERGVKEADLDASPNIGAHLTAAPANLIVIRIDARRTGGDQVVETRVWANGRSDQHTAIAGKDGDPFGSLVNGVLGVIGPSLPGPAGAQAGDRVDAQRYATLVGKADWAGLLAATRDAPAKTPRQWYYLVMAHSRLDQRDEAQAALAAMTAAHPGHFLVNAATDLIPSAKPAGGDLTEDGNTLSDGTPAPVEDDGSNVLK